MGVVGKGITYDTGGADIKTNGIMVGMSRDKCGAAAVAGLMHVGISPIMFTLFTVSLHSA